MDFKTLLLSPNGRIGRQSFWIGFAILFVANLIFSAVLGRVQILGFLVTLAMLWPTLCVYVKRLHDMNKTGWLVLVPFGVTLLALIVAGVMAGSAIMAAGGGGTLNVMALIQAAVLPSLVIIVVCIGFLIWVGATPGTAGENKFGPDPLAVAPAT